MLRRLLRNEGNTAVRTFRESVAVFGSAFGAIHNAPSGCNARIIAGAGHKWTREWRDSNWQFIASTRSITTASPQPVNGPALPGNLAADGRVRGSLRIQEPLRSRNAHLIVAQAVRLDRWTQWLECHPVPAATGIPATVPVAKIFASTDSQWEIGARFTGGDGTADVSRQFTLSLSCEKSCPPPSLRWKLATEPSGCIAGREPRFGHVTPQVARSVPCAMDWSYVNVDRLAGNCRRLWLFPILPILRNSRRSCVVEPAAWLRSPTRRSQFISEISRLARVACPSGRSSKVASRDLQQKPYHRLSRAR